MLTLSRDRNLSTKPTSASIPDTWRRLFPDFRFLIRIGGGAYGEIWLAVSADGQYRAIKFVAKDGSGDETRYAREHRGIQLLQTLQNIPAGIVPILEVREDPHAGFGYVMELADAERPLWQEHPEEYRPKTLRGELVARRALPLAECLDIGIRLAEALDFLQRHRLVHRDIKPSNIIYIQGQPVLADVGLLVDTREAESIVGTPGYVPNEQHGHFSGDIYSLGILLAEISTGRPADETGFSPVEEADTDAPGFARWMEILARATDSNPAKRHQTATALLHDLQELRENSLVLAKPRYRWPWIAGGILLFSVVLAGIAVYLWPKPPAVPDPPPIIPSRPVPAPAKPVPPISIDLQPAREAMQKELERKIEAGEIGKPEGPHPAAGLNFSIPAQAIQDGAFLEIHPDRVYIGKGTADSMADWRLVFVHWPTDFNAPSLIVRPIEPIGDGLLPKKTPLIRFPQKTASTMAAPDGVVPIPPGAMQGAPQHPYRFPIWLFLTTDNPEQWEDIVRNLNDEQARNVAGFMDRAHKDNLSEAEIRANLNTSAPFYGLQERWSQAYPNRYEDK